MGIKCYKKIKMGDMMKNDSVWGKLFGGGQVTAEKAPAMHTAQGCGCRGEHSRKRKHQGPYGNELGLFKEQAENTEVVV